MKFSLSIAHTPWKPERVECLREMLLELLPLSRGVPYFCHDADYRGRVWEDVKAEWALAAWRWHVVQDVSHCLMLSDDLAIMPRFWEVLERIVEVAGFAPLGLMSNHPEAPRLFDHGEHWYRTRAWLVGPAILFPRAMLERFLEWYPPWLASLPTGRDAYGFREFFHDDSSLNEWCARKGWDVWHPVPAPIEHRLALGRTHDANAFPKYAAEAISWRRVWHKNPETFSELPRDVAEAMTTVEFWKGAERAPLLPVV